MATCSDCGAELTPEEDKPNSQKCRVCINRYKREWVRRKKAERYEFKERKPKPKATNCNKCGCLLTEENRAQRKARCKDCERAWQKKYRDENRDGLRQRRKWIDEETYDDLKPISENWWGIITRR